MAKEYIEPREGGLYIAGTRISLGSVVHAFRRGESPETICQNFEFTEPSPIIWRTGQRSMRTWRGKTKNGRPGAAARARFPRGSASG